MRGLFRNRLVLLLLATMALLSLVLFTSIPGSPLYQVTTPVSLLLQPVQKAFQTSWNAVSGFSQSVFEAEAVRRKNEALLQEIANLQNQVQQLQESGRRWEDLKAAFQIKEAFSDYEIVGCQVMTRSAASWFDLFRVDVGDRDGISVSETNSYPVVDPAMHLVGRVYSSDLVSAKILPVLHQGSVVDGRIQRPGGYPVRVRGDILLRDGGLCFVDRISDEAILEVGDVVMTSGEGGLYPAGIPIGTIASISYGQNDAERTATLKPFVDFDTITYLFIMKEKVS